MVQIAYLVLCSLKVLKDHLEVELRTFSCSYGVILNSMCNSEADLWENLLPKPSERATTNPRVLHE